MSPSDNDIFRSLYEAAPEAVIVTDTHHQITALNPAAERLFGYDANDLVGHSSQQIYADPRIFRTPMAGAKPSPVGHATNIVHYRSRAGRIFDGETRHLPLNTPDGDAIGHLSIIRDITDELALRARLEASDIQLRAALSSANEGAYSLNLVTGLGSIRGFINEFLGITSPDATMSTQRWKDIIHQDHRQLYQQALDTATNHPDQPLDIVYRAQRTDGEWRWLHNRGRVTEFSRDGSALRISGIIADVTEQHDLEQQLAASEDLLAQAIQAGSCGVWEVCADKSKVLPRGVIREILGIPDQPEQIDRNVWAERIDEVGRKHVADNHRELEAGKRTRFDATYKMLDARTGQWIWLRSQGNLVTRAGGIKRVAGILTDVTAQKELELKLADQERLLREALISANDGAWNIDFDSGRFRCAGFLAEQLSVTDEGQGIALEDCLSAIAPLDRKRLRDDVSKLAHAQKTDDSATLRGEYSLLSDDNSLVSVRLRGRIVEWREDGSALRLAGTASDISEEQRLRQRADESETRLRLALEAAEEGAWHLNLKTQIADVTAFVSELMGLPPHDTRVTYSDWADRIHPEDQSISNDAVSGLIDGTAEKVDFVVRYNSEKAGWVSLHNRGHVTTRDDNGAPLFATGFMTDISDRISTAQQLALREEQLSDALEAASLGVWRIEAGTGLVSLSGPSVSQIFGEGDDKELPTEAWLALMHEDDVDAVEAAARDIVRGTSADTDMEFRLKDHSGEWVWFRAAGRSIEHGSTGKAKAFSGVLQNIHKAKRADQAVNDHRRRFETIYRATPAMLHTIDAEGTIREVSDYWLTHMGYSRDEVIGRKSVEFLDEESRQRATTQSLPELFKTGINSNIPYRFVRKDGECMDVLLSSFLERDEDGIPLHSFAVITDITPLRRAYEQLERTNRELDRFATVASHDLQEPLRKISAFASLVQRRYSDLLDPEGERSLDYLVDASHRMQRLIDDLLSYSRMSSQPLQVETLPLSVVINEVMERLDSVIQENQAEISIGSLPELRIDRVLIGQALQNLISNAIKYRGDEPPTIKISATASGEDWKFCISDNGIGLESRFAEKIFAPFQRLHTRTEYPGTGIGLAIVQQAIERHGGRVWVESEPGQGAHFYFTLPNLVMAEIAS